MQKMFFVGFAVAQRLAYTYINIDRIIGLGKI